MLSKQDSSYPIFGNSLEVIETQNKDKSDSITMYGKLLNQTILVTGNIEEKFFNESLSKTPSRCSDNSSASIEEKDRYWNLQNIHPKITVISIDKKKSLKLKMGRIPKNIKNLRIWY